MLKIIFPSHREDAINHPQISRCGMLPSNQYLSNMSMHEGFLGDTKQGSHQQAFLNGGQLIECLLAEEHCYSRATGLWKARDRATTGHERKCDDGHTWKTSSPPFQHASHIDHWRARRAVRDRRGSQHYHRGSIGAGGDRSKHGRILGCARLTEPNSLTRLHHWGTQLRIPSAEQHLFLRGTRLQRPPQTSLAECGITTDEIMELKRVAPSYSHHSLSSRAPPIAGGYATRPLISLMQWFQSLIPNTHFVGISLMTSIVWDCKYWATQRWCHNYEPLVNKTTCFDY